MKQEQMKDTYEHKSAMKISIRKWETTDASALASALPNIDFGLRLSEVSRILG